MLPDHPMGKVAALVFSISSLGARLLVSRRPTLPAPSGAECGIRSLTKFTESEWVRIPPSNLIADLHLGSLNELRGKKRTPLQL